MSIVIPKSKTRIVLIYIIKKTIIINAIAMILNLFILYEKNFVLEYNNKKIKALIVGIENPDKTP